MSKLTDLLLADAYVGGESGGGGSEWVEELIWENPSPASAFGAQTMPFTVDSLRAYKYLRCIYAEDVSNPNNHIEVIQEIASIIEMADKYTTFQQNFCCAIRYGSVSGSGIIAKKRYMFFKKSMHTNPWMSASQPINGSMEYSDALIPLAIYGIKKG